jgi:polysaccharide biosynthesis/export protein
MRYATLIALAGFLLAPGSARATDPAKYVLEAPDVVQFEVFGLKKGAQPVNGEFMVRPDGTVALGAYGSVLVSGMTLDAARAAVAKHLAKHAHEKDGPQVRATVTAINSKNFYLIGPGKDGDVVWQFRADGTATVASAVLKIEGLAAVAAKGRVRVTSANNTVREADWNAITQKGDLRTNYTLAAGDRVHVAEIPKGEPADLAIRVR